MAETKARPRSGLLALVAFFAIISIGEAYALLLQYQNSTFLQSYVTENYLQVIVRTIGLLVLAGGGAFLVYLAARAGPTTRAGRSSRRILSFSPVFLFVVGLALWPLVLGSLVGSSTTNFLGYVVIVLIVVTGGMMLSDRITLRMALRNFTRRKTSMAIVIAGLMIGTAMISGSLVTGDTLTELFTRGAYFGYGYADEVVYTQSQRSPGYQFFNVSTAQSLYQGLLSSPSASPDLLGVTPEILTAASVTDTTNGVVQSGVTLIGTYNNASQNLGDFHSASGSVISSNLGVDQAILNDRAAQDLNASIGNMITIFSPFNETVSISLKVAGIAVSDARARFSGGDNIFLTMVAAQVLLRQPGLINYIAITNKGGLRGSIQYTAIVGLAANATLISPESNTAQPCM